MTGAPQRRARHHRQTGATTRERRDRMPRQGAADQGGNGFGLPHQDEFSLAHATWSNAAA